MLSLITCEFVGGGPGAALGRFGQSSTRLCLLMANWKRRAIYGTLLRTLFYLVAGRGSGGYPEPKNIKTITGTDFNAEAREVAKPVVVDFYAPWCSLFKVLAPLVDALAGQYSDKLKFLSVNVDRSARTGVESQRRGRSHVAGYRQGRAKSRLHGWSRVGR